MLCLCEVGAPLIKLSGCMHTDTVAGIWWVRLIMHQNDQQQTPSTSKERRETDDANCRFQGCKKINCVLNTLLDNIWCVYYLSHFNSKNQPIKWTEFEKNAPPSPFIRPVQPYRWDVRHIGLFQNAFVDVKRDTANIDVCGQSCNWRSSMSSALPSHHFIFYKMTF